MSPKPFSPFWNVLVQIGEVIFVVFVLTALIPNRWPRNMQVAVWATCVVAIVVTHYVWIAPWLMGRGRRDEER